MPSDIPSHGQSARPRRKSVSISYSLKVVLIPSREEYKAAGLYPELWWDSSDFASFQQTAHSEILLFSKFEKIDIKSARRKLYQPNQCDEAKLDLIFNACAPHKSKIAEERPIDDGDSSEDEATDCKKLDFPKSPKKHLKPGSEVRQPSHFIDDALSLCVPLIHQSLTVSFEKPKMQKFVQPQEPSLAAKCAVVGTTLVLSVLVMAFS